MLHERETTYLITYQGCMVFFCAPRNKFYANVGMEFEAHHVAGCGTVFLDWAIRYLR